MTAKPNMADWMPAETFHIDMGQNCGDFYLIINKNISLKICRIETRAGKLKAGACGVMHLATIDDLINSKLEHGANIKHIAEKYLIGRLCREDMSHIQNGYMSCVDAIGHKIMEAQETDGEVNNENI